MVWVGVLLAISVHARAGSCEALSNLPVPHNAMLVVEAIEEGTFVAPDGERLTVPAFCRIYGKARPTDDSNISFEVWLPAEKWSARYHQFGNGGFAGRISYVSLAGELRRGNAVAATDTGHEGTGFDAAWARGHPQKIIDYGYRSLKVTSDISGALIRAYYSPKTWRRYFTGCSNGGRQALMVAQRYPDDWDGILAGSPFNHATAHLASMARIQQRLRNPENALPAAKLPAIQRAAVASCTSAARVVAGVPADPRHCPLQPATLICKGAPNDDCLTAAQAATLQMIQEGLRDPRTGKRMLFGFEPTGAALANNWSRWIVNREPRPDSQLHFAAQFFQNMVFDDSQWSIERFTLDRDLRTARERDISGEPLAHVLDSVDPDLGRLHQHGGKLLMYAGWADALISPHGAIEYYDDATTRMGGARRTQSFFRFFMVPGMMHCQGGDAPTFFGQAPEVPGQFDDPEHDARRALERWVERGVPPKHLVATQFAEDDPQRAVIATRVICPYPSTAGCR